MMGKRCVLILAAVCGLAFSCGSNESEPVVEEVKLPVSADLNNYLSNDMSRHDSLDMGVEAFMRKWKIRGSSLTIMRHDSLLYSKGFGCADELTLAPMTPGTIMRVASVSKLITATGIMVLKERGLLSLEDRVFGADGILSHLDSCIRDTRYARITVEDLLRHEGGFTTRRYGDPMFSSLTVQCRYHLPCAPSRETLTGALLSERLRYMPGTSQEYSNFGYLLLSEIIEEVTGEPYEYWMTNNVLEPAGCHDMHIAHNYYEERYPNETRYHMQTDDLKVKEYNGSGKDVDRCYGGNDIRLLSGAGAWVTSSAELARFVASIDGDDTVPDIISEESVREMTYWFDENTYGLGWNDTNPDKGWVRTGTFSGTNAIVKYYPDGECWIMITNTNQWMGSKFSRYLSGLCKKMKAAYSRQLPERNLFYL